MEAVRVVHIATQLETGGMERLLVEFARRADRRRFTLRFVALGARGGVAEEIEACGWPVEAINAASGIRPAAAFGLARLFQEVRADIVHTHNTRPLLYAGPAARLAQAGAVIHTRHGQRHGATRRQNAAFGLASRCADRVVCVSENTARLCAAENIRPCSVRTIPNGIDVGRFGLSGPDPMGAAVFVGRLTPEKDVPTLLRAVAIIAQRDRDFRLRIAGAGPCLPELRALTASLGVDQHVEFLTEVRDVPGLLRRSSMFVLPSVTEGLPLTVLEAMASGLPVIATQVGGTPEAVQNGITGTLVPPRDPAALATAILHIRGDPSCARRMGLAGHRRVGEHFDIRTMVTRYESLYEEVLRNRAASAA